MMGFRSRGGALLIVLVLAVAVLGYALTSAKLSSGTYASASSRLALWKKQAHWSAEAGLEVGLARLRLGGPGLVTSTYNPAFAFAGLPNSNFTLPAILFPQVSTLIGGVRVYNAGSWNGPLPPPPPSGPSAQNIPAGFQPSFLLCLNPSPATPAVNWSGLPRQTTPAYLAIVSVWWTGTDLVSSARVRPVLFGNRVGPQVAEVTLRRRAVTPPAQQPAQIGVWEPVH